MSALETLPPDQRAVLQLILVQGRGYDELAATLRLDPAAVRERAHAGAAALVGTGDDIDPATRGRVVDYLLGQQDDGERIVTFAQLGDSPDASRWAQALRERLGGVAREPLPEVPAAAAPSRNGSAATAVASPPATPPPAAPRAQGPGGPRPSRLGGAILIAGAAALAIVLAIVLIGGDGGGKSATSASTPTASLRPSTAPRSATTGTTTTPAARPVAAAVLRPPAGGSTIGAAIVSRSSDGSRLLAVEAARLAPNGASDIYAIWLQGGAGARFIGFVPNRVGSDGTFTVSSQLTVDIAAYPTLLVTREGVTATPTTPGTVVLSGQLRATG
ncbi:MAG TPA: sigma-70 region 4 domain-containing protein [Conexibacter sp.]|nr:sigma-70 region 4 domain-containing protein [Conexibacter sp.]